MLEHLGALANIVSNIENLRDFEFAAKRSSIYLLQELEVGHFCGPEKGVKYQVSGSLKLTQAKSISNNRIIKTKSLGPSLKRAWKLGKQTNNIS